MAGNLFDRGERKQIVMAFSNSASDLQDLSEWTDSLDLDEFCDQTETREEPLPKRQKTDDDDVPQRAGR